MEKKPKLYKPRKCPGFHVKPHMFTPRRGQHMCDECAERQRKYNEGIAKQEQEKRILSAVRQEQGQKKRQELLDKNKAMMERMREMRNKGFN